MTAQRMFLLELDRERVLKSLSVLGAGDQPITTPVYGVLVETSDGLVLRDTGLGGTALADTPATEWIYGGPDMLPSGSDGEPLQVALAELGFTVADLSLAAVSHLHLDHTGGVPLLTAAGVPVVIHEYEIAYGLDRAAQGTEREVAFWRKDAGERLDARVVPGHDAVFWKAVWHPRDGHR
ncbi:MAG: N-acyl homoserine lactone hydrolase [Frankiales bacterium]|nr:N-acyl homoserine lactone hydrolase [Frankiales bacterium]